MKRLFLASFLALLIQIPTTAINNPDLEAGNPVQLISHSSQYARITGTVSNVDVSERSKVIFLNFGKNYNTSFSAMIYDNSVPSFVMAGINEPDKYFKNKTVAMEGIIRISNGKPEMVIDSPDQIKIIDKISN